MASMNHITLIGRVVAPPELRYTASGLAVANFDMAVDRRATKKDRDNKETDFISIVAWDRLGEICNEYLTKGKLVAIQGRLQVRKYETKEGQKRVAYEVVANEMQMLSGGEGPAGGGGAPRSSGERQERRVPAHGGRSDWDDSGDSRRVPVPAGGDGWEDVGVDDVPF